MPSSPPNEMSPALALPIGRATPRGRPVLHALLLLATFYTMTLAGAISDASGLSADAGGALLIDARFLALGLPYSLCLLAILGIHEMGHYLACRRYGVDATLPFFLPGLPLPIGTFGAFIRIREPIPSRRALFDIGVAGPIAGFAVALPILIYGIVTAQPVPAPEEAGTVGEPLLLTWLATWLSPEIPDGYVVMLSGPLMAGWVGCLATALNLFPIGQLDGGHICYAISARFHRTASMAGLVGFVAMGLFAHAGWLFLATLLVMFGSRHPPVLDETDHLSRGRLVIAAIALVILIVCFIPRPFPPPEF